VSDPRCSAALPALGRGKKVRNSRNGTEVQSCEQKKNHHRRGDPTKAACSCLSFLQEKEQQLSLRAYLAGQGVCATLIRNLDGGPLK
jgi:hypothetical protein